MTPDDDLRALLRDAVSDVHPDPALDRIRRRTPSASPRRLRTWLVVAAAAATVVAIVGGITLLNQPGRPPTKASVVGPPTAGAPTARPSTTTTTPPTGGPTTRPVERALAIYFVGDTPQGPRLYREFQRASVPGAGIIPVATAVNLALKPAEDPDYRSPWPVGTKADQNAVDVSDVTVSLTNSASNLLERPQGMSNDEAQAAVQQLVYTVQATIANRRPVRFQIDGEDTDTLLGVDVSEPVPSRPQLDVLALVSITEPAEGAVVRGSLTAHGVASSFEATVPWQIKRGDTIVKTGFSTADGWIDRLYPWQTDPIDISDLAPGSYTFVAMTDDPSSGEGGGPHSDTRTIVVRR